ncbi:type II secretion system secretin GspD [Novosphingobium sp. Chol11]|uniref:type II secretion system secretin GspD n=1 Tax=Novosphingobium sp. Chol11 TaxID=1385763 RepID=UPI0025DF432B|nr:type II secretion system secretin GspD [Novosphingobium sp. Chol11]
MIPSHPRLKSIVIIALTSTASVAAAPDPIPIPATPELAQMGDPSVPRKEPPTPAQPPQPGEDYQIRATIVPGTETPPVMPKIVDFKTESGDIRVNFPDADVAVVAQAVLGDILKRNYVIARSVSGKVNLVTAGPVSKSSLLDLFERALRRSNLAMVPVAGGFEIQNSAAARGLIPPDSTGFGTEIFTLRFINADEVRKVIDSILPGVVTATDPATGAITIAGTTGQRASARDVLKQFDVDWLRNTSFALFVPNRTDARLITPSIDKLINAADSPTRGLVRLITMDQLNGILAISAQPQYLTDVKRWVEILDREGESNERKIFVYRVQNGRARDLTRTINAAYGVGGGSSGGNSNDAFADRNDQSQGGTSQNGQNGSAQNGASGGSSLPRPAFGQAPGSGPNSPDGASANGGSGGGTTARVTADETNNAIIVLGTPREYATIEDALRKLDLAPQQVLIEAAITEVSLTDDLRYGVQWNYLSGSSQVGYSEGSTPVPVQTYPGFSFFYGGSSITATLNALQERTNVKVVSAPKLLVLNNQSAALQVGDQVPISTGSATNLVGNTNAVINTIEYKDTGVILKITPRVNASGMVQLDVSQEVSQISSSAAGSATQRQSPTISTRRIATTVSVRDGEVIALGGLFSDTRTFGKNGIPFLSQIPVLGGLFGTHRNTDRRTELIVLLKPHVIANPDDARAATDELRSKIRTLEPFKSTGKIP